MDEPRYGYTIELLGGPRDGELIAVSELPPIWRVPISRSDRRFIPGDVVPPAIEFRELHYLRTRAWHAGRHLYAIKGMFHRPGEFR